MKNKWISDLVKNKTFADVGGLWGTVNERVSVAYHAGAKKVTMVDYAPLGTELWKKFEQRCSELKVDKYDTICADMTDTHNLSAVGIYDIVHCSGILYHLPDPMVLLQNLSSITNEYLLLGSTTIPSKLHVDDTDIITEGGTVYFIPALSEEQKRNFSQHFDREGLKLMGINNDNAFCWYDQNNRPNFSPWWWLFTPEYVTSLLEIAGFEVVDSYESWHNKAHMFLCKKIDNRG